MAKLNVFPGRVALASLLATLAACGGGGVDDSPPTQARQGVLRLSLTDAPACGLEKFFVTVQRVRLHRSASAGESEAGWQEIVLATPLRVDLLTLNNGALRALGQIALPAGRYQQLRLVLEPNSTAQPLANAVQAPGGSEIALETPSALQSGLKLNANIDVAADTTADLAIDFDACKSVHKAGDSGRYQLKPVLSVIPLDGDEGERIVGYLDASLGQGAATVMVQSNSQIVRATPTEAGGRFVLYPVPAGSYDLVISANGRASSVIQGVPVSSTATTQIGSEGVRVTPPPASAYASISGRVTVNGTSASTGASIRALQLFSSGQTVEVAYAGVDADNGQYAQALPIQAPARLSYVAGATSFPFLYVSDEQGRYRIEASAPGQATKSQTVTLVSDTRLDFALP